MKPVKTKADFVKRYKKGEFGNRTNTWETVEEFINSDWEMSPFTLYHLRSKITGGETYYNMEIDQIQILYQQSDMSEYYVSEMAPTDKTIIQGEIQRSVNHYDLTYAVSQKPMRDALKDYTYTSRGIQVPMLLKCNMDYNSYDWLNHLFDVYEDHVIEFSTYSVKCGTLNYNTIFWEVRNY